MRSFGQPGTVRKAGEVVGPTIPFHLQTEVMIMVGEEPLRVISNHCTRCNDEGHNTFYCHLHDQQVQKLQQQKGEEVSNNKTDAASGRTPLNKNIDEDSIVLVSSFYLLEMPKSELN